MPIPRYCFEFSEPQAMSLRDRPRHALASQLASHTNQLTISFTTLGGSIPVNRSSNPLRMKNSFW